MDYDTTSAALTAASDAGAEISQAALLWLIVFAVTALSIVTLVAVWVKKHAVRYYTGQILVVVLALAALWPAWYDSDGGLLWLATVIGLVLTAIMTLKRRYRSYNVRRFADELAIFNEKNVRPHWLPEVPSH